MGPGESASIQLCSIKEYKSVNIQEENYQNQMALPGKRRSALVFKQKFDLILVLRLSEVSIREHNLSSNDSAAASRHHLNSPPGKK